MIQKQNFPAIAERVERPGRKSERDAQPIDDVEIYTRHTKDGVPIRALARELGCHASTVLRRIRRFEDMRDDPLIDSALSAGQSGTPNEKILRQVLRRMAEPGAIMATSEGMANAIVSRDGIRTAALSRTSAEAMALRGWIVRTRSAGSIQRYIITPGGRAALRRILKGEPAGECDHADQHRMWGDRFVDDPEDGRRRRTRVNIAESPLQVLARRTDTDGQPFLSPGQVAAGERLREDFELAQMGPRVAQNWDGFLTAGIDCSPKGFSGGSGSARERVSLALRDLGPEMGDLVLRVCCFLEGIEMTERRLGFCARSGKVVLKLALIRLERLYKMKTDRKSPLIG